MYSNDVTLIKMEYYSPTNIMKVFWPNDPGFKTGRDSLGIQFSSVVTYDTLLPGLSNITDRLRYYSMYSWLIDEFINHKTAEQANKKITQIDFIRRAEVAFAAITLKKNSSFTGMIGADKISRWIHEGDMNLAYCAKNYVANAGFTHNYSAILKRFNLITEKEIDGKWAYLNNPLGLKMAQSVRDSVAKKERDIFIAALYNGILTQEHLEELESFSFDAIIPKTSEWNCLADLILTEQDNDFRSNNKNRINTIAGILKAKENCVDWPYYNYLNFNEEDNTSVGWFYYYNVESLHYAAESIFWAFLASANSGDLYRQTKSIVTELATEAWNKFGIDEGKNVKDVRNELDIPNQFLLRKELREEVRQNHPSDAVLKAITLILAVDIQRELHNESLVQFEKNNDLYQREGSLIRFSSKLVTTKINLSLKNYLEKILFLILRQHIKIACAKTNKNGPTLLKFVEDEGRIIYANPISPSFTSPRLRVLSNFLSDLKLINDEFYSKDLTNHFLKEYEKE